MQLLPRCAWAGSCRSGCGRVPVVTEQHMPSPRFPLRIASCPTASKKPNMSWL
uniref:Uncharacterized protein n=1 Tax=Arundo donax TaxID=35708 RepID=A0A0A9E088_ARUDO